MWGLPRQKSTTFVLHEIEFAGDGWDAGIGTASGTRLQPPIATIKRCMSWIYGTYGFEWLVVDDNERSVLIF